MSIIWVIPFKTRLNWNIPGYPSLSFSPVQGYPVISHLVQSYPHERYPRISQDIPGQDSCLGISHYKFSVLGYRGLSRDTKHQVGLSRDIQGYPLWSFFQMVLKLLWQVFVLFSHSLLRQVLHCGTLVTAWALKSPWPWRSLARLRLPGWITTNPLWAPIENVAYIEYRLGK